MAHLKLKDVCKFFNLVISVMLNEKMRYLPSTPSFSSTTCGPKSMFWAGRIGSIFVTGKLRSKDFFSFQANRVGPGLLFPPGKCHEQILE